MGNLCGGGGGENKTGTNTASEVKLLLLGSGESGKSTFFKQIKILYDDGYSEEELFHYKSSIYANIFHTIKVLSQSCIDKGVKFENPKNLDRAQKIIEIADSDTSLLLNATEKYTEKIADDIAEIWKDKSVKEAFTNRYDYHVFDGAEYFFKNLERLKPGNYTPTSEDVLRCRRKTTGIVEVKFTLDNVNFRLYDVGGQRNERKKWIHCFDKVTCVLFVASLSDYDQKCYEDDITNRMIESMDLFDEIVNGNWFKDTHVMLFLNKCDVFKRKIQKNDLKDCFPKYDGSTDFDKAKDFIEKKFKSLNKFDPQRIHTHFTQATDSKSVQEVFLRTKDTIVKLNLTESGSL